MNRSFAPRLFLLAVLLSTLAVDITASAETAIQYHERMTTQSVRQLRWLRNEHRRTLRDLRHDRHQARAVGRLQPHADIERWGGMQRWAAGELRRTRRRFVRENRAFRTQSKRLERLRDGHAAWLAAYAVFEVCPVPSYSFIYDDFGQIVQLPGVPRHVHMGSDVTAPYGSRIVAPFDGNAVASSSVHGGLQVRVYGARGYVYNAHLSSFGRLGWVRAGETIGYVGSTGDSTAPHDHIEWHPGDGGAADAYLYLARACVG